MRTITMSSRGQVAIPADIRHNLHLGKATRFTIEIEKDSLILTPIEENCWQQLRGSFPGQSLTGLIEEEHLSEKRNEKIRF